MTITIGRPPDWSAGTPGGILRTMSSAGRILYVITDLEVGGVPLHLLRLAGDVRRAAWDVTVASLKPAGPIGERLQAAGVAVRDCAAAGRWDWRVVSRLADLLRAGPWDVVHSLLFHANLAARLAARRARLPRSRLICEIQTVEIERRWHLWVDRWTWPLCRCTVVNSPSVLEHLHRRAGIPRERLHLIRGGVQVEAIRTAEPLPRSELGVADDDALVLWTGRLDPVKGLDTLLEAVARLRSPRPLRLLLAGEGPLRPVLESRIAQLNLGARVSLLGRRDDVPRLLRTADLFVFPSRTEGSPNALLEAMAAGLPVVAGDVAGCRDVVENEHTGLLVPPDNPLLLAAALERLLANPSAARALGDRACHYVSREHSWSRCAAGYLDLYARRTGPLSAT